MSAPVPKGPPSSWRRPPERQLVAEPAARYRGYRVPSARLPGFDYGHGVFFVTVVTGRRVPWFGRVRGGELVSSACGRIAADEWARTETLRAGVSVDAFVAMPDHVHGVIVIRGDDGAVGAGDAVATDRTVGVETPRRGVSTAHDDGNGQSPTRRPANGHRLEWKPNTLGAIVGRFKYACTRRIRTIHPDFAWQPRFYDVVIRDRRHLDHVQRYIATNPARWTP